MNIWYTYTGAIDAKNISDLIVWVNAQIYGGQIKKLTLFISSTGGDIDSAIRLHHYLKGIPVEVEIIGFGQIDSAANIIFLAAKNRKALKGCRFFLHEGTFTIASQSAALHVHEETLGLLQTLLKTTVGIIASETSKKTEDIESILKEGKILTTQEALEFGLVAEIIDKLPDSPNKK